MPETPGKPKLLLHTAVLLFIWICVDSNQSLRWFRSNEWIRFTSRIMELKLIFGVWYRHKQTLTMSWCSVVRCCVNYSMETLSKLHVHWILIIDSFLSDDGDYHHSSLALHRFALNHKFKIPKNKMFAYLHSVAYSENSCIFCFIMYVFNWVGKILCVIKSIRSCHTSKSHLQQFNILTQSSYIVIIDWV